MTDGVHDFPAANKVSDISARDLISPLFRRKRLILITFLATLSLVVLLAIVIGPVYTSHMSILVDRERVDPLVTTEAPQQVVTTSTPVTDEEINSEVELLKSQDVLEQVVLANNLEDPHGFSLLGWLRPQRSRDDRIALAVKGLAKGIKVEVVTKTNVINVTYSSAVPQRAFNVLKTLGDFYRVKHVVVHRPTGSYDFFAAETERYRAELVQAENNLRNFGKDNRIAAPDLQQTNLALQVAASVGLMHLAEQAIAADEGRIHSDQGQMAVTPSRSPTQQLSSEADKLLEDLNASLLAAQTKRTQLVSKYQPDFPLVQEADAEIAQVKSAIANAGATRYTSVATDRDPTFEFLREDLAKTRTDLAGQQATLAATKRSVLSIQSQMVDLNQQALTQQDLVREQKANEANYLLYLAKREQERTTNALDSTRISNVAIAVPPSIPVLPAFTWSLILTVGIFAAGAASLGVAYTADYLDSSFHSPAQVAAALNIPIVLAVSKKTA